MLQLNETKQDNCSLVEVIGRLDTTNYGVMEEKINEVLAGGVKNIVINLEQMEYVSSSGLRVFLIALKKLNAQGGKLLLFGMQETVQEVFKISGFSSIFTILADKETALANL